MKALTRGAFIVVLLGALTLIPAVSAIVPVVFADGANDLAAFEIANLLYEEGHYEEAAQSYERLTGLGYRDATLYYNLGNAYFEADDIGRATLNYMRAQTLARRDADIRANLESVRSMSVSISARPIPTPTLALLAENMVWLSYDVAALVALVGWAVAGAVGASMILRREILRMAVAHWTLAAALLCLTVFGAVAVGNEVSRRHWQSVGVVTQETADVFNGPGVRYSKRFTLAAGSEIRMIDSRLGWSKIGIHGTGLDGWIPSSHAEAVFEYGR